MGEGEAEAPSKTQKSPSTQEQPPSSPAGVYPDWASLQAYYNTAGSTPIPPPGFFHPSVAASPQGHPYMWSPQLIPPYGAPPHAYVTMYPPGGLYPHPSIPPGSHPYSPYAMPSTNGTAESSVAVASGAEADGKSNEGKEKSSLKRSRGSLGSLNMLTGKDHDIGKASGASGNGIFSQSGDSGSEGSSEDTEGNSPNGSQQKQHEGYDPADDEAQNDGFHGEKPNEFVQTKLAPSILNQTVPLMPMPQGSIVGPPTTLNIGMEYWGGSAAAPISTVHGKLPAALSTPAMVPSTAAGTHDGVSPWMKDEKELKRERRKQSNRESARRSRLRKQAECEEHARRVAFLKEENDALREELGRLRGECERLTSENALLTGRLKNNHGAEARVDDARIDCRPDCNSSIPEKS